MGNSNYLCQLWMNSQGLVCSLVLLLGSMALVVFEIQVNKWLVDFKLVVYVLMYAVFLCFSIIIQLNFFTLVNLPMCIEH